MRQAYAAHLAIVTGLVIGIVAVLFAVAQSPELREAPAWAAMAVPHPVEAGSACDGCHGPGDAWPYPAKHLGWNNASCLRCHAPENAVPGTGARTPS